MPLMFLGGLVVAMDSCPAVICPAFGVWSLQLALMREKTQSCFYKYEIKTT
jgi:hypothetical protein